MPTAGKYYIVTYGCQMNKSDSERAQTVLESIGLQSTESVEQADLILINTCSVRQTAENRVFGQMQKFAKLKHKNPKLILAVTGCMPGRDKDGAIKAKLPLVDFFFPITDLPQLPRWIAEHNPAMANSLDLAEDYLKITPVYKSKVQAFVPISNGCSKFCTYCTVPFSRGTEVYRPIQDIIDEIKDLAAHGCLEITLLGQTVNRYEPADTSAFSKDNPYTDAFAALLWELNQIEGIERIHFTAPHPLHMSDEVIDALTLPKQLNFLHLPVQSGDNEVLRKMNRKYTQEHFREVIDKLYKKIPHLALGTDIIVGFCGETEEQFKNTLKLYEDVRFDISYNAMYSPRSGTAAYRAFKDDVPHAEKKRRWRELHELMEKIVLEKNQRYVEQVVSVLVDDVQEKNGIVICSGNSREMKVTKFPGTKEMLGTIVPVKVTLAQEWILFGEAQK